MSWCNCSSAATLAAGASRGTLVSLAASVVVVTTGLVASATVSAVFAEMIMPTNLLIRMAA